MFFQDMFKQLEPMLDGIVIIGGDSNVAFDQGLDKNRPQQTQLTRPPNKSSKIVKISQLGLADIWMELNPTKRDFTHYSYPHNTYARIDHIFLSISRNPWQSNHQRCCLGRSLLLHKRPTQSMEYYWRPNESIL